MRKDIAELMQAADAFVMSSLFEGLPLVLIEAHAAGLPIVATRVGGNPEVVRDGITGYLCEPDNSRALAQAMRRLRAQDEETRNRMGTAAREHVQRQFSLSSIVPQWERLYSELLQRSLT
jgi:glycosyltransferase involved in cell wall biosynthesis